MDRRIQELIAWGCDVPSALERMLDDEDFLLDCLNAVLDDPSFDALDAAVAGGDAKAAFTCAHTLKGVLGNVGLTPMYDTVCRLVEPLRAGSCAGLENDLTLLRRYRQRLTQIMGR